MYSALRRNLTREIKRTKKSKDPVIPPYTVGYNIKEHDSCGAEILEFSPNVCHCPISPKSPCTLRYVEGALGKSTT